MQFVLVWKQLITFAESRPHRLPTTFTFSIEMKMLTFKNIEFSMDCPFYGTFSQTYCGHQSLTWHWLKDAISTEWMTHWINQSKLGMSTGQKHSNSSTQNGTVIWFYWPEQLNKDNRQSTFSVFNEYKDIKMKWFWGIMLLLCLWCLFFVAYMCLLMCLFVCFMVTHNQPVG